jgi:hypothetical protein
MPDDTPLQLPEPYLIPPAAVESWIEMDRRTD